MPKPKHKPKPNLPHDAPRPPRPHHALHVLEAAFALGAVALYGTFVALAFATDFVGPRLATFRLPDPAVPVVNAAEPEEQPRRHLDGIRVAKGSENHWPIGVMIENSPSARPQFGLSLAKVVIEAPAESGVTRFLALYDGTEGDDRVGPVRSARHYYVSWSLGWSGVYAHAGSSPQAQAFFRRTETYEAEALGSMARSFFRDRNRAAPHNLFTDLEKLRTVRRLKHLEDAVPTYTPWIYADAPALEARGTPAGPITVGFAGASYRVVWTYDRERNLYLRENGGRAHVDAATNAQIGAANVAVIHVGPLSYLGAKGRIDFPTVGTGKATVFRNGEAVPGTWSKPTDRDMLRFIDGAGAEIPLTPGSTWIEVLVPGQDVTF